MNATLPSLDLLVVFVDVVEAGSITHGAERSRLALAAASARIRGMEEEIGSALLVRSRGGVTPTAADEAIKTAYRKAARLYHPDKNPDPSAAARFRDIQAAYELLADPARRRDYDLLRQRSRYERVTQGGQRNARHHLRQPGLHVAVGRRPLRQFEHLADRRVGHLLRQEAAHRAALLDHLIELHAHVRFPLFKMAVTAFTFSAEP